MLDFLDPNVRGWAIALATMSGAFFLWLLYASVRTAKVTDTDKVEIALEKLARQIWVENPVSAEAMPRVASNRLPIFGHSALNEFFRKTLEPYVETALISERLGPSLDVIIQVLMHLDMYGDCPSVVDQLDDPEYESYSSMYDVLRKVNLRDHTLHVAEETLDILKTTYADDVDLVLGRALVVALAHDLGKIPEHRKGSKGLLGNHPHIAAAIMEDMLGEMSNKGEILAAIRDHHKAGSTETLVQVVREADKKAREKEMMAVTGKAFLDGSSLDWVGAEDILGRIEPCINVAEADGSWAAFTMNDGVVYVQPVFITKIVEQIAAEKGVQLNAKQLDRKAMSTSIVHRHLKDALASEIGQTFSARICMVKMKDDAKEKRMYLTPLKAEAFRTPPAELENRKRNSPVQKLERIRMLALAKGVEATPASPPSAPTSGASSASPQ